VLRLKRGEFMPKYMFQASYTPAGIKSLVREGGSKRRGAVGAAVEALGGRMEAFYYAFGSRDLYVIADLPDNVASTALALAVNQSGLVEANTVVLITADELDRAAKTVRYRARRRRPLEEVDEPPTLADRYRRRAGVPACQAPERGYGEIRRARRFSFTGAPEPPDFAPTRESPMARDES
jgi:uncharacterized protein with GYD domain